MPPAARPSARASRREAARALLARWDLDGVAAWAGGEPQAARELQHLLFDPDELVAWRAVEALGRVAEVLAHARPEAPPELVRRAFWLMNDESGGVLWNAPQVVGAVLARVPALCAEFGPVLASFLEEEPFRPGTRWGLWRISAGAPGVVREAAEGLRASFRDPDPAVRALAALALRGAGEDAAALSADGAPVTIFDFRTGALRGTTVGAAASGAF